MPQRVQANHWEVIQDLGSRDRVGSGPARRRGRTVFIHSSSLFPFSLPEVLAYSLPLYLHIVFALPGLVRSFSSDAFYIPTFCDPHSNWQPSLVISLVNCPEPCWVELLHWAFFLSFFFQ